MHDEVKLMKLRAAARRRRLELGISEAGKSTVPRWQQLLLRDGALEGLLPLAALI